MVDTRSHLATSYPCHHRGLLSPAVKYKQGISHLMCLTLSQVFPPLMQTTDFFFFWMAAWSQGGYIEKAESTNLRKSRGGKTRRIINVSEENFKALLTNFLTLFMTARRSGFQRLQQGMKGDRSQRIVGTFSETTHYLTAKKWRGKIPRHRVHLCGTIVHNRGHVRAQHEPEQWHLLKSCSCPPKGPHHSGLSVPPQQNTMLGNSKFNSLGDQTPKKAFKEEVCPSLFSLWV